jgi:MFS family permease
MRRAGFVGLLTAETISVLGTRMSAVAVPWLVLVTTGSATRTGIVAFAEMLPYVLVCAGGGPLIDRFGARRTSVWMDAISVVGVGAIPLLYWSGGLSFGALVALVVGLGTARGLGDTSKQVLFPSVVTAAGVNLNRAASIHDGLNRLSAVIGAPLAGVLIAVTDAPAVLLVDAVSFGVAAIVVATTVSVVGRSTEVREGSYKRRLADGVAYVGRDRLMLGLMAMLFVTNLLDQAYGAVYLPVWAKEVYGSALAIGLVSAALAIGAVAGNLAYTALSTRLPRWAPFTVGFLIGGAPRFVALAVDSPLWTILSVSFAAGVGISVVNPILMAVVYERVPEHMRARVFGLATALAWAGIPLGGLFGGLLVGGAGLRIALLVAGLAYLGATLLPLTGRTWREMDRRPSPPVQPDVEDAERGDAGRGGTQDRAAEAYR